MAQNLAACKSKAKTYLHRLRCLFVAPPYCDAIEYTDAQKWLSDFKPNDVGGYDKALEYAWRVFDQVATASDTLDKKADNLLKSAGLIAGLLGLAINTLHIQTPLAFAPSLLAFIVSLIFAAVACNPTAHATSAAVNDLLEDISSGLGKDSLVAGSLHCAIGGRNAVNNWKARRIRWSTTAFVVGLLLLLVPVFALYSTVLAIVFGIFVALLVFLGWYSPNVTTF